MSERTRIVLFGLAGQGKSSIANMLIQGDIYDEVKDHEGNFQRRNAFKINDGAVGASVDLVCGANDVFEVYDTIGVGETVSGSVPHNKAVNAIRNYFTICQVPLNYIAYVKKQGRFTVEDRKMFQLFKNIFEGSDENFIIIITNSGQRWVERNLNAIKKIFGDYPIIPVDFPWDEEEEDDTFHRNKRAQSLQILTNRFSELQYKGIEFQVLSSFQTVENIIAQVIDILPVAGSTYQLISSGVYYKIGKKNLAKQRLRNGAVGAVMDIACVGALRVGVSAGKVAGKSVGKIVGRTVGLEVLSRVVRNGFKNFTSE
ncbi:3566_t:CDS:1 [Funneliformis caledonium]|uniref:3566_t:CDS:1 n=1 Tax=Funneliformis caledonium TaxID=1117310 RepID=A0A9N9EZS1_9GLOM|nr:3566_t:CDS:1 [Funneliformis caledonium]